MKLRLFVLPIALLAAACGSSSNGSDGGSGGKGGAGGTGTDASGDTAGCKAPTANVETLIPGSGVPTGWTVETGSLCTTRTIAETVTKCSIDGSADPFITKQCTGFASQVYKNGTKSVDLWTFENKDSCAAKGLYDYLASCPTDVCGGLYDVSWETLTGVGDGARIANTGTRWWVNAWVGAYYFEFKFADSAYPGGEPQFVAEKPDAIAFATAVAGQFAGH